MFQKESSNVGGGGGGEWKKPWRAIVGKRR